MDRLSKRSRRVLFAFLLFGLVQVVRSFSKEPGDAVMALSAVPVAIVAFEMGWRTGLGAAAVAFGAVLVWAEQIPLSAFGYATRGATYVLTAIVVGVFADRLREAQLSAERSRQRAALLDEETRRTRDAALAERARLARELHDVIAHSVSVMTVQASAVRRLLKPEQEREREALLIVEQTGREAMAEMRRMVGVLRRPEEAPALAPQPSLEHLDKLIEHARESGLPVKLTIEGDSVQLPAGVDLTAYRLVQEGLTNALKHARAKNAEVVVRYSNGFVELSVTDDGTGDGGGDSGGHGLVGMRERISVYGGDLEAGPRPEGGYRLHATLPVGSA